LLSVRRSGAANCCAIRQAGAESPCRWPKGRGHQGAAVESGDRKQKSVEQAGQPDERAAR